MIRLRECLFLESTQSNQDVLYVRRRGRAGPRCPGRPSGHHPRRGAYSPIASDDGSRPIHEHRGIARRNRSSDSRNCAVPGRQWEAHVGNAPTTLSISTADTTTLVFSRSVCKSFFIFCWGGAVLEEVFTFSEGAFWTLFGGRAVDIRTVGKWDDAYLSRCYQDTVALNARGAEGSVRSGELGSGNP